jgi:hypothetical protein
MKDWKNSEDVLRQMIEQFCQLHVPQASSILLHGSYANGRAEPESDIDLLILSDEVSWPCRIQQNCNGLILQAMVFNFQHALAMLNESKMSGNLMFSQCLATAKILREQGQLGEYLIGKAKHLLNNGPMETSPQELESRRISLLNYLQDGGRQKYSGRDQQSAMRWACRIIDMVEDLLLSKHHAWRTNNPRFKTELMIALLPKVQADLVHILQKFIKEQNKANFSDEIRSLLQPYVSLSFDSQLPHCSI